MSVRIEKQGPVTTVILSRPQARNAVDPQTASALAGAFRDFEADPEADVAVLWGAGGNFCAGADLKALAEGRYDHVPAGGDGPVGPFRFFLPKPVIAPIEGFAGTRGMENAPCVDLTGTAAEPVTG